MPRRCTICDHPERTAIDRELVAGTPLRHIAERFGLSLASVARHKDGHLPRELTAAREAATAAEADDLLAQVARLRTDARRIAERAERRRDLRTALQGIRELSRLVELQARLLHELSDGPTVNLVVSDEWRRVRTALLAALAPYPEARAAVAETLAEVELCE